jgi:ferredoxin
VPERLPGRLHPRNEPDARDRREECIDCGACEPECPVDAILPEDAVPEDWAPYVKINYAFPDKDLINKLVDEVKPPTDDAEADAAASEAAE